MKIPSTLDLVFPLEFLKNVVYLAETDPDSNQKWKGNVCVGDSSTTKCFIVTSSHTLSDDDSSLLSISLKNVKLTLRGTKLSCKITGTESDADIVDQIKQENEQECIAQEDEILEQPPKRKRGRKRKSETEKSKTEISETITETPAGGRYKLRGVKIPEHVMKAVIGSEYTSKREVIEVKNEAKVTGEDIQVDNESERKREVIQEESESGVTEANIESDLNNESKEKAASPLHEINPDDQNTEYTSCYEDEDEDYNDNEGNGEYDEDFIISSDEDFTTEKKKRKRKLARSKQNGNISRTRKNKKIDLGDIPKAERRKNKKERNSSCKYCSKLFTDYTGVDIHVKKYHTKEKDFDEYVATLVPLKIMSCEVCGQTFSDRLQLQDHEDRNHRKTAEVKCFRCGKTYKNINSLRNHVRCVHFVKGQPNLCHLCPAKFKWRVTLRQHIEEIHDGKLNSECTICGKKFARDSLLKRHQRIHGVDQSKRLVCSKCGKGFWYECNLQRHLQCVHSDQQEMFHCSYCGKGFNNKYGMMTHVQQVHFNLYPFKCPNCNSGFTSKTNLKEHLAKVHKLTNISIHVNNKTRFKYGRKSEDLYFCSYCNASFCYKAKLVNHMHTAHSDNFPHKCNHCNQGFLENSFLLHHLIKAHGEEVDPDMFNAGTDESLKENSNIAKLITLNIGPGNKEVYTVGIQTEEEETETETQGEVINQEEVTQSDSAEKSSLMFEVSTGTGTIQYVINKSDDGEPTVLPKELADLLFAADAAEKYNDGVYNVDTENNSAETVTIISNDVEEHVQIVSSNTTVAGSSDLVHVDNSYTTSGEVIQNINQGQVFSDVATHGNVSYTNSGVETQNIVQRQVISGVVTDRNSREIIVVDTIVNKDTLDFVETVINDIPHIEGDVEIT